MDFSRLRDDFPIFERKISGHELVYLDNSATTQKPRCVIDAMVQYYTTHNANIHRGIHTLAEEATHLYEAAHRKVADYLNAESHEEIILVRNTTEAMNLLARTLGEYRVKPGNLIVATVSDHHSNLIPWHQLAGRKSAKLALTRLNPDGSIDLKDFSRLLDKKPVIVTLPHVSNVLGIINDIRLLAQMAREAGAVTVVDGAQSVPHLSIDVRDLGVDFFAFSAHKMLGPLGVGILYGRKSILDEIPPFMGGGAMISDVHLNWEQDPPLSYDLNDLPWRFEAGTPDIAGMEGLSAAMGYLSTIGHSAILEHDRALYRRLVEGLKTIPGIKPLVPFPSTENIIGAVSFTMNGYSSQEVASYLDTQGICVRSGMHCAHPLHLFFGAASTVRITPYLYNTTKEVDLCLDLLKNL